MAHQKRIELENGKYTYVFDNGRQHALRHGQPWRDLVGDKFVYCMASRIEEQENYIEKLEKVISMAFSAEDFNQIKALRGKD